MKTTDLRIANFAGALVEDETGLATDMAPRPYVHPIFSTNGTLLTDLTPADHIHHLGLSLPIADIDGVHYWGGKTFVLGQDYVDLDNHGSQTTQNLKVERGDTWAEEHRSLLWQRGDGSEHLHEQRTLRTEIVARADAEPDTDGSVEGVLTVSWRSNLTAPQGAVIGSPATNGRPGAGYGGIFWRFPQWEAEVFVADGAGEDTAHGAVSPWLCVSAPAQNVSALLSQHGPQLFPWFARVEEYLGVCPALAWDTPLTLSPGETLEIGLDAVVLENPVRTTAEAAALWEAYR